jgi:hypothetical protein
VNFSVKVPDGVPFFPGVVLTVAVELAAVVPLSVTDGDSVHVVAAGAPVQLSDTVPTKPLSGVKVSV